MDVCRVCGKAPAEWFSFRRHTGMLVMMRMQSLQAPLCRDHALEVGHDFLRKTLLFGWWGFLSFFLNFGAVGVDLAAIRKAKRLPPPDTGLGAPHPAEPTNGQTPATPPMPMAIPAPQSQSRSGSSNAFGFDLAERPDPTRETVRPH